MHLYSFMLNFLQTFIENGLPGAILKKLWRCLVCVFKQQFSVFKQHFTYFNTFFHSHVFPQIFLNNNFQFLNTCIKQTLYLSISSIFIDMQRLGNLWWLGHFCQNLFFIKPPSRIVLSTFCSEMHAGWYF